MMMHVKFIKYFMSAASFKKSYEFLFISSMLFSVPVENVILQEPLVLEKYKIRGKIIFLS